MVLVTFRMPVATFQGLSGSILTLLIFDISLWTHLQSYAGSLKYETAAALLTTSLTPPPPRPAGCGERLYPGLLLLLRPGRVPHAAPVPGGCVHILTCVQVSCPQHLTPDT